ncbi:BgTH12-00747, partial [Blumeria graminis f. sp. triticale]
TSRLYLSHSFATIQATRPLTHSLPYPDWSLCYVLLMVTLSGVWEILCI